MKLLLVTFCLFAYSLACTSDSSCPTGKICKFGSCFSRDEVIIPGDCADPNEEWLQCAVDCRPTCSNPNPWCKPDCSKSGCHCKSDFVYENGRCVSKSTCRGSARPSSSFTTSRPSTQKACFTDSECLSYNCKSGFCAAPGTSSFHPPPSPAPTRTSWSSSSSSSTSLSSFVPSSRSLSSLIPASVSLRRRNGDVVSLSSLERSYVGLFFCAENSEACKLFLPLLVRFSNGLAAKRISLDIIYLGLQDRSEQRLNEFSRAFPAEWILAPFDPDSALTLKLISHFGVRGVPHILLYKDGRIIDEDIRPEIHFGQNDDPVAVFEKITNA